MKMRFISWLFLGLVSCAYAETDVFVSADAASGGDGSRGKPYQSLTQARDGLRAARKAGTLKAGEAVTVSLEPGVYSLSASFELNSSDSGTASAPVVYRARKIGTARIQGGVALEAAAFKPVSDAAVLARLDESVRGKVLELLREAGLVDAGA